MSVEYIRRLALIFLVFMTTAAISQTHILTVNARMDYSTFVQGEKIMLELGIQNNGATPYIIDDYGAYTNNQISVYLRNSVGNLMLANKKSSVVANVMIMPESSDVFNFDLCDLFDIDEGRYQVTVVVKRGEYNVSTRPLAFSVVRGLEIGSKMRIKEGNENIAYKYALLYWARKEREYIFLRITDATSGELYGFAQLGTLIRAITPVITFHPDNIVEIVHQASRDGFLRTCLDTSGSQLKLVSREELISTDSIAEALATRQAYEKIRAGNGNKPQESSFLRQERKK